MVGADTVEQEYQRRLTDRRAEVNRLSQQDRTVANLRLGAFALVVVLLWLALLEGLLSAWWSVLPCLLFAALLVVHDRVLRRRDRAALAVDWYEHGLARLQGRWAGRGPAGRQFVDPTHPYSGDLDLFGHGSLFQLLCTARTRIGEECLAAWLSAPAETAEVRDRQEAVAEMRDRLDLREELAVLSSQGGSEVDARGLAGWAASSAGAPPKALRATAAILALCGLAGAALWVAGHGLVWLAGIGIADVLFGASVRGRVRAALSGVNAPARDLWLLGAIVTLARREPFRSAPLLALQRALGADDIGADVRIRALRRLVDAVNMAANPLFIPLAALLLWHVQFAFAIEAWRVHNGPSMERWLDGIGRFEALSCLSCYACERPHDPFPVLTHAGTSCRARALAHPFLPADRVVANDVALGDDRQLLIVSGSNMSGKSTLLRAVGINAVLALAGAPVRAASLELSRVQVASSMRAVDDLQAGVSHFYAEITRLHQVVALADERPVLFLLDEILHGTNSHDRLIGAAAIVRALAAHGAIGLVTTHDLALARLAEEAPLHAANVHFEDHMAEGRMAFDYRLREGVVSKSNAIELMRAVGLPV